MCSLSAGSKLSPRLDFNLYFAFKEDDQNGLPIGVLVSIRAGDTSTYIIATSNDTGRSMQANSVLLWEAIVQAKRDGCSWYDIGGLTKSTPKGIASFKKGLNAEPYTLIGDWIKGPRIENAFLSGYSLAMDLNR